MELKNENGRLFGDISHEKHATIPEGVETVNPRECHISYDPTGSNSNLSMISDIEELELPKSLKEFSLVFWPCKNLHSVYYHGDLEGYFNIKFVEDPLSKAERLFLYDVNDKPYEIKEVFVPSNVKRINNNNYFLFKSASKIHFHKNMEFICAKYLPGIPKQEIYFECSLDEVNKNEAFAQVIAKIKSCKKKVFVLGNNNQYQEADFNNASSGTNNDNNSDFVIKDNELVLCNATGDVVIPDGVTSIAKMALAKNTKINTLTIPSSVTNFGLNNINSHNTKNIKVVYFKGTPKQLEKVKGSDFSNVLLLSSNVYCLKNNKYEQIVNSKKLYFKTNGFDQEFLKFDKYSFVCDVESYFKNYKGEGFNTIVCFEDGRVKLVFECKKDQLDEKIVDSLINKKIEFACDDYLVDNLVFYAFIPVEYNFVIKDGTLLKCEEKTQKVEEEYFLHPVKCELPSDIKRINENAFSDFDVVILSTTLPMKSFLKIYSKFNLKGNPILLGHVKCIDGVLRLRNINHQKADKQLYYSGCHFNNRFILAAISDARNKTFFEFNRNASRALYMSSGKYGIAETASIYDDDVSDEEYCVFDFDNFNRIQVVDFEAG